MDNLSPYERQRLKNIKENKRVLESLGLLNGPSLLPRCLPKQKPQKKKQGVKRKRADTVKQKVSREDSFNSQILLNGANYIGYMTRRQSKRLLGKEPEDFSGLDIELAECDERPVRAAPRFRENVFGSIPGVSVGTTWASRIDCSHDGVHRPTVAGIHGNECEGCYSLALSGGYEDDLDYGVCFTYTGEGGRDLKGTKSNPKNLRTAPQSKDQTLTRGNLALSRNVESGRPVRVIRGYKLNSSFAPDEGYRYDGLYTVERFWQTVGLSGFMVYKFALRRCPDQPLPPWEVENEREGEESATVEGSEIKSHESVEKET